MTFTSSHPTILTAGGSYFNFQEPENSRIVIEDIAHALANVCRFTGHCREFYSVAQHSLWVSTVCAPQDALHGLLHDAAEAYIGDVSSPLKALLPDYKGIEKRVEAAVLAKFGLPAGMPHSVKHADLVLLATEQRDFLPEHDDEWIVLRGVEPLQVRLQGMSPEYAERAFMRRFQLLTT